MYVFKRYQVKKDLDLVVSGKKIHVGSSTRAKLIDTLERDAKFLRDQNRMDYSVLIGVHYRSVITQIRTLSSKTYSKLQDHATPLPIKVISQGFQLITSPIRLVGNIMYVYISFA